MFDATALSAITDELNDQILHGRVQEIVQTDELAFALEFYARHTRQYLYLGAHPNDARVHLISRKVRGSGQTPSSLLLLLRKHAENAFVDSITQLPHERVLKIQFDHSAEGPSTLVIETIGRYSNLILVDPGGMVIDSLKRNRGFFMRDETWSTGPFEISRPRCNCKLEHAQPCSGNPGGFYV